VLGLRAPALDDSIVSATLWVPLITAAVGLITGLGTSAFTQRRADSREDVRWQRESQDRQDQWRQERQTRQELWEREDSHRWLQDRQQAYARLMAALYTWDDELRRTRADRNVAALLNERSELETPELRHLRAAARDARALVDLMASETVRRLGRSAQMDREMFGTVHLAGDQPADPTKTDEAWAHVREGTVLLREAMRSDLGLESTARDDKTSTPGWPRRPQPPRTGPTLSASP
jgi:hypothetical protein